MSRTVHVKGYIDANVLDEAKARLHHIYDTFDTVMVAFSGGKDSLTVLHLVHQVTQERGLTEPVKVVFRDEELIPDSVLDFVNEYRLKPWVDMRWYCIPLESTKYILGATTRYVQWDVDREWLRPKPAWGITSEQLGLDPRYVLDQYTTDELVTKDERGKTCILTGVRASESLRRFSAMTAKLSENYINGARGARVMTGKPIFDWMENDIFRFFYDFDIRYCPIYDRQILARHQLRVATPLHAEHAKTIGKLREFEPGFYNQLIQLFPEMAVQERYYKELDRDALVARYGQSLDGVQSWIDETLEDEHQHEKATKELKAVRVRAAKSPQAFPPDYVLQAFMGGGYKRSVGPLDKREQAARRAAG